MARQYQVGRLEGAHVLLTGATGFVGQAILERLLSSYPTTRVSLLVRARGSSGATARLDHLLGKPVFGPWRERVGDDGVTAAVAERVSLVEGDIGHGQPALPDDLDVVIHCASTVSFDPPIDEAFRTNVHGTTNLYGALAGTAAAATGNAPHVVHVSTAYVAGARKGTVPEQSLDHTADWERELAAALAARDEVERQSRRPEQLSRIVADARREHAKAGPQSVAAAAEQARYEWMNRRLIAYGQQRAQSLGWPDVYTFTKALGERVAEQRWAAAGNRLSIVRPAIVESALRRPYPGWIDGFKMAEPLILAYGRGVLPEFPGVPDSVVDIIPVDLVVNATLAVAATDPEPGEPGYFHVGSGARNPLTFRGLYEHVLDYFQRHPLPDGTRGQIKVPTWQFPGSVRVDRMLRTAERAVSAAEKTLLRLPGSPRSREWMTKVHRKTRELEFLRRYSDLYGVYTQAEVIYADGELLALQRALPADRAADDGFDPIEIDWTHYLTGVHLPSVTASMRPTGPGVAGRSRPSRELPERTDVVAVFDLEGTIVAANLIESYLWACLAGRPSRAWPGELGRLVRRVPRYLAAERTDRAEFVRAFLRRYEGAEVAELRRLTAGAYGSALMQRVMPEAVRQIRRHRVAGHRTVLITGAIDVLIEPVAALFDEVVASRLHVRDGTVTGFLDTVPVVGEARAAWLRRHAGETGMDLSQSYAYGDSYSDRPLLETVGHPSAVNPDPKLYGYAKRKHWTIHEWGAHASSRLDTLLDTALAAGQESSWLPSGAGELAGPSSRFGQSSQTGQSDRAVVNWR